MIIVSIIVAVHNAGAQLRVCLDSLVRQTLSDIQIVAVCDCPTDGSDEVVKEYASRDSRIIVVENKRNLHIGESRNRGLQVATGEYVAFMDHDDFCDARMLEELYSRAKGSNADIVFSPISKYYLNTGEKVRRVVDVELPDNSREYVLNWILTSGKGHSQNGTNFYQVHGSLYRRSLIAAHGVRFVDTKKVVPEDVIFNIEAVYHSASAIFVGDSFYYHVQTGNNTGGSLSYYEWDKRYQGLMHLRKFMEENHADNSYKERLEQFVVKTAEYSLLQIASRGKLKMLLSVMSAMRKDRYVKSSFRKHRISDMPHSTLCSIMAWIVRI